MNVPMDRADAAQEAHTAEPGGWWSRRSVRLALIWSAVTAVLALAWALGWLPSPFADPGPVNVGAVLNAFDPLVGSAFTLVLGLLGTGCAVVMLRSPTSADGRAVQVGAWLLAAVPLLILVHGQLLAILGYSLAMPVLAWIVPGLGAAYLELVTAPETIFLLHSVAGGLIWAMAALTYGRGLRGACGRCGRTEGWTPAREAEVRGRALRVGRAAVAAAVAFALVYPAMRIPWLFGIPVGMGEGELVPEVVSVGIGLASGALAGVVLMLGLVQNWGVRFPRWMAGLSGRRVPISLAVVPAAVVAVALTAMGRAVLLTQLAGQSAVPETAAVEWVHLAALASMGPWGIALAVATAAYAVRRRAECATCGRGLPEELPR